MKEFIHNKVQVIEGYFSEFNLIQKLYSEKSFDFDTRFNNFLIKIADYFNKRGESSKESEVLRIINMLQTVRRGFNPVTMEKIGTGKREMLWGFSYNGIESVNSILQEIYNAETVKLEEGVEILTNLLLSLYQQGVLTDAMINEMDSIARVEAAWVSMLSQNGSVSLINKKLMLNLIAEDIYMILEKIILKMINQ